LPSLTERKMVCAETVDAAAAMMRGVENFILVVEGW
jgi:hypothetical protein